MFFKNLELPVNRIPVLDKEFIPFIAVKRYVDKHGQKEVTVAFITKQSSTVHTIRIMGLPENLEFDQYYVERTVKFLLWMKGASKVLINGDPEIVSYVKEKYSLQGERSFDVLFMSNIYEQDFSIERIGTVPSANDFSASCGGNLDGCRIGFDAGGSDLKISAVIDGETVFSEEVVWHPKVNENPAYHYEWILSAMKEAAKHMPAVHAIGVSSAGIYVNNRCMVSSLFMKVPKEKFDAECKDIYIRAAKEIGAPLVVMNDGDVAALAGAMNMEDNDILGIAMGTSQAAGYVDKNGNIKGWLNELAFAAIDFSPTAARDEWSGDIGCGVKYFSQDSVIKLAKNAGIEFDENSAPAQKLAYVQQLLLGDDERAKRIFESIGVYLGHTAALYYDFYKMKNLLLMGRVVSAKGGDIILAVAKEVLAQEYPDIQINMSLPDEKMRRVGQAVAAASIPKIS